MDIYQKLGLKRVINAAGTMTYLGSSRVSPRVIEAMNLILPEFVDMRELQQKAGSLIARATGAEAGCITASAAAGIAVATAACMTGSDLWYIEQLPDTASMRSEIIIQKGHSVSFGAGLAQTIRITGASCVEIGSATQCGCYQLRGAINDNTAALVYVASHHAVQSGLISLQDFCAIGAEYGIPVIIDAASEYDLKGFLACGAQLAVYSGHKFLGGPTSGIIAGCLPLVRACYMQEKGIGRTMKVGKESIAGVMEALEQWLQRDAGAIRTVEEQRIDYAFDFLKQFKGIHVERTADPTGNPVTRLKIHVHPTEAGLSAFELCQLLAAGNPTIRVRAHEADTGSFQLDPCQLLDGEMELVCEQIQRNLEAPVHPQLESTNPADLSYQSLIRWPD
ncbi:SelA-like pyridoxal phosphate-dependent enzyme [Paenibacillus nasutitermitis]|uniref:SelA-like pyridoxal phosphate-dependent enzyme n=1 Tax=Paenibacillus nasutitermitis TaxID=1652958 RepID=UPI001E347F62|nr:SelA-like pyridoxal phosphate-dependent enzyme [Paenibacillus nasutitermitis]